MAVERVVAVLGEDCVADDEESDERGYDWEHR